MYLQYQGGMEQQSAANLYSASVITATERYLATKCIFNKLLSRPEIG